MPALTEIAVLLLVIASIREVPFPSDNDLHELRCLARNVYHEAGGETDRGKAAVAHVTLNRARASRFPETVCAVVHQVTPIGRGARKICQFSWYCDGLSDQVPLVDKAGNERNDVLFRYIRGAEAAVRAYHGLSADPTGGALYFYAHNRVRPAWADGGTIVPTPALPGGRLGEHTFLVDGPIRSRRPPEQIAEPRPPALPSGPRTFGP